MRINKNVMKLVGLALFAVIISRIDFRELSQVFRNISLPGLILAAVLVLPQILIKAYRWNYIKKLQGINYHLKDSFLMYGAGLYLGLVTPGRIGDFLKVMFLRNDGHPFGKSLLSVFLDRILDLVFLLLIGYIGMVSFFTLFREEVYVLSGILGAGVILLGIIFLKKHWWRALVQRIVAMLSKRYKEKAGITVDEFYQELRSFTVEGWVVISVLTIITWSIYFLQIFILAQSLHIGIGFISMAIFASIADVISILPLSISGIGTRDITLIVLFERVGIHKEAALAISLLMLFLTGIGALLGLTCWLKKPIPLSQEKAPKKEKAAAHSTSEPTLE